jgi:hypothetical protein
MWINQKNRGPDEQQDSVQKIQNSFGSGEIGNVIYIPKAKGFSQSLFGASECGDIAWQKPNISRW